MEISRRSSHPKSPTRPAVPIHNATRQLTDHQMKVGLLEILLESGQILTGSLRQVVLECPSIDALGVHVDDQIVQFRFSAGDGSGAKCEADQLKFVFAVRQRFAGYDR